MKTAEAIDLKRWLKDALRQNIPSELAELLHEREVRENIFLEMLTQVPKDTREALERLYELHMLETALTYRTIEELFKRHLESHTGLN